MSEYAFSLACIFPLIAWKVSKYGAFSGPCFPVFGLNKDLKNSVFGLFFHTVAYKG